MAAVIGLTLVRRAVATRRQRRHPAAALSRRQRKVERARARAAARWVEGHVGAMRELLDTSESASAHLSAWDNARRTADAYLSAAQVVRGKLATTRAIGPTSAQDALETKLRDLHTEAEPQLHAAATAVSSLARSQTALQERLRELRTDAPRDIVSAVSDLVATHDSARLSADGAFDERQARERLDHLTRLREVVERRGIAR